MGTGKSAQQFAERIGDGLGEAGRNADRHGNPDAVAQPADVLDRHPPAAAGEGDRQRTSGRVQPFQPAADISAAGAGGDLLGGQRAQKPQQIGDRFGVPGRPVG